MTAYQQLYRELDQVTTRDRLAEVCDSIRRAARGGELSAIEHGALLAHADLIGSSSSLDKQQVIPLENLRRLDLKPGDMLAVIAPDEIDTPAQIQRFQRDVQAVLDAREIDAKAIVFPPGTKLDVLYGRPRTAGADQ